MPIHGKQHPDCQRKPINYDRDTTLPAAVGILLFMAGRGGFFFFRGRTGRSFFFRGGTGRLFFFFRGGTGCFFFFFSTGRDEAVFFFFRGPGRDGCFLLWQFFWRDGEKSLHCPAKDGLNRPASRSCKALFFFDKRS